MDTMQAFFHSRCHALAAVLHDINQAPSSFDRLWLPRDGRLLAELPCGRSAIGPLDALYGIGLRCVEGDGGDPAELPVRHATTVAA